MSNETIDFYNKNANEFCQNTFNIDFTKNVDSFLKYIKKGGTILELGTGAGRDAKYIISKGYSVVATDYSLELVKIAQNNIGQEVIMLDMRELNEINVYDGVWACASMLHLTPSEIEDTFIRIHNALKEEGIVYCSFKYGYFTGTRNGRYFTDLTEDSLSELHNDFEVLEQYITQDVRADRSEKWLNVILKKNKV